MLTMYHYAAPGWQRCWHVLGLLRLHRQEIEHKHADRDGSVLANKGTTVGRLVGDLALVKQRSRADLLLVQRVVGSLPTCGTESIKRLLHV